METALGILIMFPLGAAIIGCFYLRMYYKLRVVSAMVAGFFWLIYSIYEFLIYARIFCSGECNIRVDLLIIYPSLLVVSLLSTGLYYHKKRTLRNAG